MNKEEKQAIKDLKNIVTDLEDAESGAIISLQQDEIDSLKIIAELIEQQQKEIEKLKEIIIAIRHELKGNVITKDGNNYAPAKNLTKQEVYESYVKLSLLLKANYIFKEDEDVIKELLEE